MVVDNVICDKSVSVHPLPSLYDLSHANLSIANIDKRRYLSMLGCRVQGCIDTDTYDTLCEYMEEYGIEKISTAVRKILKSYLSNYSGKNLGETSGK